MALCRNLMGLLLAGGIAPHDPGLACDLLPQIATTAVIERAIWASSGLDPGAAATVSQHLYELFSSLPPRPVPNLTTYAGALIDGDADIRQGVTRALHRHALCIPVRRFARHADVSQARPPCHVYPLRATAVTWEVAEISAEAPDSTLTGVRAVPVPPSPRAPASPPPQAYTLPAVETP